MALYPQLTLTILNGATGSEQFTLTEDRAFLVQFNAPATLPETVKVHRYTGTYTVVQDGGFDVVVAAGKTVPLILGGGTYALVATSGAVAGDRAFKVDRYGL